MAAAQTPDPQAQALAAALADAENLRGELEETNRGVLALYAELDAQAAQLREATELKSRFLAYMSHEFRTPINAIRSITRLLIERMDGPLTPEQEKQVGFIQTTAAEFAEMVDDLLDLAKVEAGRVEISPAWFEMVDLFSALRGMFKPILTSTDVVLIFEEPQDVPKLFTDHHKLSQILRNFISNALKFTPQGEVRVAARRSGEDTVTFSVADTGMGIAPEHHEAVFQDFSQVDSPIQKRLRGTGLGLSLSRRLAVLLGGDVALSSELGKGSVFSVTIPVRLAGYEDAAKNRVKAVDDSSLINTTIDRGRHRVLVVDDNPATRYSTARVLRAAGFQTEEAGTGVDALGLTPTGISAVVLDVHLPDMNGFDICRAIRANADTSTLPVIHLSAAFVKDEDKVAGLNAGADAYLVHPVEPAILIATLQALVRARMAEDQLRRSETRFRAIHEQAPSGIALIDDEGRFVDANPAMVRLVGRERAALLGRRVSELAPPEGAALVDARTRAPAQGGSAWQGEFSLLHADGRLVDMEWSLSPHIEPGLRVGIAQDVSERAQLARRRHEVLEREQAARVTAERHSRTKDDFIAVLSHELRTPLNAIVSWVDVLSRPGGAGMMARGLEVIERNARTQARIISDILDVARINSGKLQLAREWADPAQLVATAIDSLRTAIEAKQLLVERDFGPGAGAVQLAWLDPARFQQIFWNLMTNAIKFSEPGSSIVVSLRQQGGRLQLAVQDFGQGIRADFIGQLFERFTQSDAPGNRRHGGLGLGLSIVRHLVELHGGSVTAASAGEGHGSTLRVDMPIDPAAGAQAEEALDADAEDRAPAGGAQLAGLDILVVDDDADTLETLGIVLGDAGAGVRTAPHHAGAMAQLDLRWPDVLISDIGLPGRDGYDLIADVRARAGKGGPGLLALALTAFARPEDRARALAAGFDAHFSKPLSPHTLTGAIAQMVASARAGG